MTIARFDGGMHDLTLSGKEVRAEVFRELGRWVDAFVPAPGNAGDRRPATPGGQPAGKADDKSQTTA